MPITVLPKANPVFASEQSFEQCLAELEAVSKKVIARDQELLALANTVVQDFLTGELHPDSTERQSLLGWRHRVKGIRGRAGEPPKRVPLLFAVYLLCIYCVDYCIDFPWVA